MTGEVAQKNHDDLEALTIGLPRVPTPKISTYKDSKVLTGEKYKKNINPCYKLRRFYLPSEVETHCSADDCWVSFFN